MIKENESTTADYYGRANIVEIIGFGHEKIGVNVGSKSFGEVRRTKPFFERKTLF